MNDDKLSSWLCTHSSKDCYHAMTLAYTYNYQHITDNYNNSIQGLKEDEGFGGKEG